MNKAQQYIDELISHVSGADEPISLEHKCFNGICFFLIGVFFISAGFNYLLGLGSLLIWGPMLLGLLFCWFYYLSRYRQAYFPLFWIVLALGVVFANVVFFYSGGITGTATIIFLNIIAVINLILLGWRRRLAILLICLNLTVLYYIEYINPSFVVPYESFQSHYLDLYYTFLIAVLVISFLIHFSIKQFRSERRKVAAREEQLRALLDNLPDSVWLKDRNEKFTMVNKPFLEISETSVEKAIGGTVFDVWPHEKAERFEKDDKHILSTGEMLCRQEIITEGNGVEKRFEVIQTPIMDPVGKITGVVGTARDITSRYEYEDRLKKFKQMVDTSQDQMALINGRYVYEAANESYLKAFGLKEEDLVGKNAVDIAEAIDFDGRMRSCLQTAFNGETINFHREKPYAVAGIRQEDVSYFPHRDDRGRVTGVVVHIKDITEKIHMARRLNQSEKMEAIGTLAGGIAHDFNNILSGILGYAQLGKIHLKDSAKLDSDLDQIMKGAKRAGDLVRQILTFSRQYEYEKEPLKTATIVKEALKLIRASIPTSIEIEVQIASETHVLADPSQIHQIVMNLCTNAYQSMKDKKGTLTVSLTQMQLSEKSLVQRGVEHCPPGLYQNLRIADTGSGIDAKMLEKIFDPYFTTKEMEEGTGLGLALVQGIVDELGGFIDVKSQLGKGSIFSIYLPVVDDAQNLPEKPETTIVPLSRGSGHIMIVDDETSILFSTSELLEDCGYEVTTFSNGAQAYEAFTQAPEKFDLVITDMTMPKMTGDVLAASILEIRPELPVILCTGYSDSISEGMAREIGIRKYLQKPLVSTDLTAIIHEILNPQKDNGNSN